MLINFRGVGISTGRALCEDDLFRDGCAAFRFLLSERGARSRNIAIHGHSLGGAVGVRVRGEWPDGPIVSDRSFGRLTDVVREKLVGIFGAVVGAVTGVIVGGVVVCTNFLAPPAGCWLDAGAFFFGCVAASSESTASSAPFLLAWYVNVLVAGSVAFQLKHTMQPLLHGLMEMGVFGAYSEQEPPLAMTTVRNVARALTAALVCSQLLASVLVPAVLVRALGLSLVWEWLARPCLVGWQVLVIAESIGVAMSYTRWLPNIIVPFMCLVGWRMDVVDAFRGLRCPKAVIYHRGDAMIPLVGGSLYHHVAGRKRAPSLEKDEDIGECEGGEDGAGARSGDTRMIEMMVGQNMVGNCHMYPLDFDWEEWSTLKQEYRSMWAEVGMQGGSGEKDKTV